MSDTSDQHPFTRDRKQFAALGAQVMEGLETFLEELETESLHRRVPDDQRRRLMGLDLPEDGQSAEDMIGFLKEEVLPWPIAIAHPRCYAWICAGIAPVGALADLVASTMNTGLDGYDHASIFLNVSVARWLMELTGFSDGEGFGVLFSGGSAANLNALTAARYKAARDDGWDVRAEGLQGGRPRFMIYTSEEAHSSIQKCAEQLGLGQASMHLVETDDDFRLIPSALRAAIEQDLAAGHRPMCVVAGAGRRPMSARSTLSTRWRTSLPNSACGSMSTAPMAGSARSIPTIRTPTGALIGRTR